MTDFFSLALGIYYNCSFRYATPHKNPNHAPSIIMLVIRNFQSFKFMFHEASTSSPAPFPKGLTGVTVLLRRSIWKITVKMTFPPIFTCGEADRS